MWSSMIMATSEFIKFRRDLEREYRQEIATGHVAGFTFFSFKQETGERLLLIPPGAVVLFERLPRWREHLRPHNGSPNLKGSEPVSLCWGRDG